MEQGVWLQKLESEARVGVRDQEKLEGSEQEKPFLTPFLDRPAPARGFFVAL